MTKLTKYDMLQSQYCSLNFDEESSLLIINNYRATFLVGSRRENRKVTTRGVINMKVETLKCDCVACPGITVITNLGCGCTTVEAKVAHMAMPPCAEQFRLARLAKHCSQCEHRKGAAYGQR